MLRTIGLFLAISFFGGCGSESRQDPASDVGGQIMSDVQVEKIMSVDQEILEEWGRVTSEPDLLGVGAVRIPSDDWPWQVHVSVMEFIRAEPLESELAVAISAALAAVPGVTKAAREDREQWAIKGCGWSVLGARSF